MAEAPFEKLPIYDEKLVLVAAAGHAPIKSVQDAKPRVALVFEPGCSYRKRLEDWFALKGEMPERVIEMTSYHAMLGCVVVGMGVSLMPRRQART